jgi:predicted enzyme related to lactoylglutathione lyase
MAEQRGRVTGLGGVFWKARDRAALAAWYREQLGLPFGEEGYVTWEWGGPGSGVGRTVVSLFPGDTGSFGPGSQPFMINLRVEGLDALLARLRAAGVPIDPHLQEEPYGRFAWITDPEGNRVELWEPRPAAGFPAVPMR